MNRTVSDKWTGVDWSGPSRACVNETIIKCIKDVLTFAQPPAQRLLTPPHRGAPYFWLNFPNETFWWKRFRTVKLLGRLVEFPWSQHLLPSHVQSRRNRKMTNQGATSAFRPLSRGGVRPAVSSQQRRLTRTKHFLHFFPQSVKMIRFDGLLKAALVTVVLVVASGNAGETGSKWSTFSFCVLFALNWKWLFKSSSSDEKLATCCEKLNTNEITEPILGYLFQKPNYPCIRAIMWVF